jgi:hypothetical protein
MTDNLTASQQEAFLALCAVVSHRRCEELLRLKNWQHGGCLSGRPRPNVQDVSDVEDAAFRRLWLTLPGSSCWMSALYIARNNHPEKEPSDEQDSDSND